MIIVIQIFLFLFLVNFLFMPFVVAYGFSDSFSGYLNKKFINLAIKIKDFFHKTNFIRDNAFVIYIISLNILVTTLVYLLDSKYQIQAFIFLPFVLSLYLIAFSINYIQNINKNKIILEFLATVLTAIFVSMVYNGFNIFNFGMIILLSFMISKFSKDIKIHNNFEERNI